MRPRTQAYKHTGILAERGLREPKRWACCAGSAPSSDAYYRNNLLNVLAVSLCLRGDLCTCQPRPRHRPAALPDSELRAAGGRG
ncbi:hypothetical protein NDU88_012330 [Pleurodeles waltl]|uniref:Uncharacterized protein n=1 Tax=Pleurodeles waltl TaxID=8319 RepID=A0AAV7R159_PLEWA|nr:hypothetical protein NDU88_012330 [Pleurodeles waltl]